MSFRRFSTQTLVVCSLIAFAGCRDRSITVYRAPKDPAPVLPSAAAAPPGATLPEGHPPIGQAAGGATLPEGHPPIGDAGATAGAQGPMMTGDVPTSSGSELAWTAPANWQVKGNGSMRKGSYSVPGDGGAVADFAITAFPGDVGGLFANVNRWRGQIGLPPIDLSQLASATEHLEVNGFKIELLDALGTVNGQPTRLLGAIVPHNGQTWFFKLLGPDAVVAKEKPALREFLNTIKARQP